MEKKKLGHSRKQEKKKNIKRIWRRSRQSERDGKRKARSVFHFNRKKKKRCVCALCAVPIPSIVPSNFRTVNFVANKDQIIFIRANRKNKIVKVAASSESSGSPQSITLTPLESSPNILTLSSSGLPPTNSVAAGGSGNTIVVSTANETTIQEVIIISQTSSQPTQRSQQQQQPSVPPPAPPQHQIQQRSLVGRDISSSGGVMTG